MVLRIGLDRVIASRRTRERDLVTAMILVLYAEGCPVAVEVFDGNTGDPSTVASQIRKIRERFRLSRVVMVGDRGMLTDSMNGI